MSWVDGVAERLGLSLNRSSAIAYGGWALLSGLLVVGTFTMLDQAERTERGAVLGRAQAGAATLEQSMLRVFEGTRTLQAILSTRQKLLDDGNMVAAQTIEQQLLAMAKQLEPSVRSVSLYGLDGTPQWPGTAPPEQFFQSSPLPAEEVQAARYTLYIGRPKRDPQTHAWSLHVDAAVHNATHQPTSIAVVTLDPVVLSSLIAVTDNPGPGSASLVQRRSDGAIIAASGGRDQALSARISPDDPVLIAAASYPSGQFRDMNASVDRLVGFRAPSNVPIVVSQSFDTSQALQEFYTLRRVVVLVLTALISGAFVATRLVLANYLLRSQLGEQAMEDPLTGLRNRRYFAQAMPRRLAQAHRQGEAALVLLIDLDGFKQVNDTRGHPVGDALLREVAARLRRCTSPSDIVMRLGGDEFAVVRLGRTQRRDATALARYIVNELGELYDIDGYHLRISASVGVAMPPDGGEDMNDLLRSADIALYFVKADGGGAYRLFDPAMENSVRTRRALEVDLREALTRGELELYFQPLVQLEPRRVSGFEALLRWHHPELGVIMPGRFIPIAEETGVIASIGEWVLRQACAEAVRWPGQTRIAVNLSPVQFERSDIVDIVATALRETRLQPGRLELEITEGVVMRDMGDVLNTMRRLQELGVRLALDDFGTGYASLSYLRSFPFDKVKIDGSFLADLAGDGGTIIRAVLGLCGHLRLDTLVEGVETEEQLDWLKDEGCTEVQGHLFSVPRPAKNVPEVIGSVAGRVVQASKAA